MAEPLVVFDCVVFLQSLISEASRQLEARSGWRSSIDPHNSVPPFINI